jgi:parvulin-like peptidyl-prolyl isomerase
MRVLSSGLVAVTLIIGGVPAEAEEREPSAAVVDGSIVEAWEAKRELQMLLPASSFHRRLDDQRRSELEHEAVEKLILKELKRQWAIRQMMEADTEQVDRQLSKVRGRFESEAAFRRALEQRGITEAALRRAIERDQLADDSDARVRSSIPAPTDAEARRFYADHRADYMTPESRHVIHVLVHVPPSAGGAAWEAAAGDADDLAAAAQEGTTNLAEEAARRHSDLPPKYRDQTGDLGTIHRGALQAVVDEAVFSADPGDVVGPIRTIYGFSVIEVRSVNPPHQLEFAQVSSAVHARLLRDRREAALLGFESGLREAAVIEEGPWPGTS